MERQIIEEKFETTMNRIRVTFNEILDAHDFDDLTEDEVTTLICMLIEKYIEGYYNGYFKTDPIQEKKYREWLKKKFTVIRKEED